MIFNNNDPYVAKHTHEASDVGLGNVPNVATNDQTPTFTQASTLANIASGEKLSVIFGKVMKGLADLISHLANKSNPHSVTAKQTGAAASTHASQHASSGADPLTPADIGAADLTKTVAYKNTPPQIEDLTAVPSEPGIWLTMNGVPTGAPDGWSISRNAIARLRPGNDMYALDFLSNYVSGRLAYRVGASKGWQVIATATDLPVITAGTTDLTAGTSALATGAMHLVYE